MVSEATEPGSESGKRSDDRRGAARGTRAGSWSPQEGGASNHLAARLLPRSPGSFAAAVHDYPDGLVAGWREVITVAARPAPPAESNRPGPRKANAQRAPISARYPPRGHAVADEILEIC